MLILAVNKKCTGEVCYTLLNAQIKAGALQRPGI